MENPPTQQPEKPATGTPSPEKPASQPEYYYSMEPDQYGLVAPYLQKFDFEDREHIDDSEFYCSDEEEEYRAPNAYERVKRFLRQVRESRGYDVDCMPPPCMGSPFMPRYMFREYEELCERVMNAANFAIGKINAETGKTYELVDVENVVETRTFMLLLTLTAKEVVVEADTNKETAVKTFRAMVYQTLSKDLQLEERKIKEDPVATVG